MSRKRKPLVIFGNGDMARMIFYYLCEDYEVVAFAVDEDYVDEPQINDIPVVAFSTLIADYAPELHCAVVAVGFVGMNRLRQGRFESLLLQGYTLVNYIHPTAVIAANVELGKNVIILEHVSIHAYSKIGDGVFISSQTNLGHDSEIKNHVWINAGVAVAGGTVVGECSVLGMNSSVANGLTLAAETFVAANVYINRNTESGDVFLPNEATQFRMKSQNFLKFMKVI